MNTDYRGHHWTHNKYRHNGKWVSMPKDIITPDGPALKFGKEIVMLPGILTIQHTIEHRYSEKPLNPGYSGINYRKDKTQPAVAQDTVIANDSHTLVKPTAIIAPIAPAVPIASEPMTYRQKRYIYVLTKRNINRADFTKSQASALITELTGA